MIRFQYQGWIHMATHFQSMTLSGVSTVHTLTFFSKGQEYELSLQSISAFNTVDSSVIFPNNYTFSASGCWEISFDLVGNMTNGSAFEQPVVGIVNGINVFRTVERAIYDHYSQFKSGMYIFQPDNGKLAAIYNRMLKNRLGRGFTLEIGLDPDRRSYVLRTPKCY